MKAAVLTGRRNIVVMEVDDPSCARDEIIIRTERCGICRTDRKAYHSGQRDLNMPRVLGHEIAGCVREAGKDFASFAPGDRVVIHPGLICGTCGYCGDGRDNLCDGMRIIGFNEDGGFQEYIKLNKRDEANILRIPASLASDMAALSEPMACAVHQKKMIGLSSGRVLIVGSGALGILSAKLWGASGAVETVIVDINPKKIKIASEIGLDACAGEDFAEKFPKTYFDAALVCCPTNDGLKTGIGYLKKGGALGFFSGLTDTSMETSLLNEVHYRELRVYGSYGCSLSDTKDALNLLPGVDLPGRLITEIDLEGVAGRLENIETDDIFTQIKYI
ncbi:MAG: alcohol dehydrogenase catalytic domain-containing protein [Synergistaceae bacterium]|jgi:L-iditol 2-dehydrogenase|nr:alcohol dehydrogenase catalytic domain-containing protein [Synergistaceae bacterium]